MSFSGLLLPGLLLFVGLWGLAHRVDVYAALLQASTKYQTANAAKTVDANLDRIH